MHAIWRAAVDVAGQLRPARSATALTSCGSEGVGALASLSPRTACRCTCGRCRFFSSRRPGTSDFQRRRWDSATIKSSRRGPDTEQAYSDERCLLYEDPRNAHGSLAEHPPPTEQPEPQLRDMCVFETVCGPRFDAQLARAPNIFCSASVRSWLLNACPPPLGQAGDVCVTPLHLTPSTLPGLMAAVTLCIQFQPPCDCSRHPVCASVWSVQPGSSSLPLLPHPSNSPAKHPKHLPTHLAGPTT